MPRDSARAFERRGRPTGRARGFRRVRARRERVEHRARTPCASARPRVRTSRSPFIDDDARAHGLQWGWNARRRRRDRPTAIARLATAIATAPALPHTRISTMSALLASSFVGRVAAFKATKIQVRIFSSARATRARAARRGRVARRARTRGRARMRIVSRGRARGARAGARGRADGRGGARGRNARVGMFRVVRGRGGRGGRGGARAREWIRARGGCARIRYGFRGDLSGGDRPSDRMTERLTDRL